MKTRKSENTSAYCYCGESSKNSVVCGGAGQNSFLPDFDENLTEFLQICIRKRGGGRRGQTRPQTQLETQEGPGCSPLAGGFGGRPSDPPRVGGRGKVIVSIIPHAVQPPAVVHAVVS